MRGLTAHQQLTNELERARERVREAITGLSEESAVVAAADGWSIKDHLAHLAAWHEMRFFEISRIARGGLASFPVSSEDRIASMNDLMAENRRSLPLDQLVADLEFAWDMVAGALAACPEDRLAERYFAELGPTGSAHDVDHAEAIAALRSGA